MTEHAIVPARGCLVYDMPYEEYASHPGLRQSTIFESVMKSPAHGLWRHDSSHGQFSSFRQITNHAEKVDLFGSSFGMAFRDWIKKFRGEDSEGIFDKKYFLHNADEKLPRRGSKARAALDEIIDGRIIIESTDLDKFLELYESIKDNPNHPVFSESSNAKTRAISGDDDTPAFNFGRTFHDYMAGWISGRSDYFDDQYYILQMGEKLPRKGTRERDQFDFWTAGKSIITQATVNKIKNMRDAVLNNNQAIEKAIYRGDPCVEVSGFLPCPDTGLIRKARADAIVEYEGGLYLIDWKSAQSAHPDSVAFAFRRYGYTFQSTWYCDVFKSLTSYHLNREIRGMVYAVVESSPPYATSYSYVTDALDDDVRLVCQEGLKTWKKCESRGFWPGYSNEILPLGRREAGMNFDKHWYANNFFDDDQFTDEEEQSS